jgi:hypothetical protein
MATGRFDVSPPSLLPAAPDDLAAITRRDLDRMRAFWNLHGTPLLRRLLNALPEGPTA